MRNFKDSEFLCKCGCGGGIEKMDGWILSKLDNIRDGVGFLITLNSAYRCPKHNTEIGSTSTNHTGGWAVDISCADSVSRYKIIVAALKEGITRIGISKSFIHIDNNPSEAPKVVWFY